MDTLSAPVSVRFDLTNECNLSCKHCRANGSPENFTSLDNGIIKELIREMSEMNVFKLKISGGEPFIREDIFEILNLAEEKIQKPSIVSNGILLDEKKIQKLENTGVKDIAISLDGMKETHEKIRGKGTFEKTIDAIKLLVKGEFNVTVVTTLSKINMKDYKKLAKFTYELGVGKLSASNLMPYGRGAEIENKMLDKSDRRGILNVVKQLNEKFNKKFLKFDDSFIRPFEKNDCKEEFKQYLGCRGGRTECSILSNGDVVPCKLITDIVAGNIKEESFKKIWRRDEGWGKFRDDEIKGKCRKCEFGKECRGGCKAMSYFEYNNLNYPDPRCDGPY